jgi:T5orf172 domain
MNNELPKWVAPTAAVVYIIKAGDGYFKIGIARNVRKRLTALQTANPLFLSIAATRGPIDTESARRVERYTHFFLRAYRTNGEWFACSVETAIAAIDKAMGRSSPG